MDSLMTLISVLVPMFAGFFIRVPKPYLSVLDRMLSVLVYAVPAWKTWVRSWTISH